MKQTQKTTRIIKFSCPTWYQGNLFLLILFLIIWPPIGILLGLKNIHVGTENSTFYLLYHGKWGWVFFWGIFFFPIAFILLLIKGINVIKEKTIIEQEAIVERY